MSSLTPAMAYDPITGDVAPALPIQTRLKRHYEAVSRRLRQPPAVTEQQIEQHRKQREARVERMKKASEDVKSGERADREYRLAGCPITEADRREGILLILRAYDTTWKRVTGKMTSGRHLGRGDDMLCRWVLMAFAREWGGVWSLTKIAALMGARDHTTVYHGLKRLEELDWDKSIFLRAVACLKNKSDV